MTPSRWQQIEKLYHAALECEPGERAAFLVRACDGDADLRGEVESLLEQNSQDGALDRPAFEGAQSLLDPSVARITAGTLLGPYRVEGPLGAGGMGEVYRAKDTKLDREVAIKVLPSALATDPERLARFGREAKVLASLNHYNIAQIYGIEESSGIRALVMELVPGKTLHGPLPMATALDYARQIADALEAAHEKGIIHRDLKPANIMITPAGVVKVLDFGLAAITQNSAASAVDPDNSPTLTMATQAGMILGTASYMAPEQAAGQPVDRRADIWAFGVVLYEMLTGQRLFTGDSIAHILADVLRAPIDFTKLPQETPRAIRNLLKRCLDRNVKTRLQAIGEARIAIQNTGKDEEIGDARRLLAEDVASAPFEKRPSKLPWATAAVLATAAIVASLAAWAPWRKPLSAPEPIQFQIQTPERPSLTSAYLQVSPDGRQMVFGGVLPDGHERLWLRSMDSLDARVLSGTDGPSNPFWSPDSRFIAFLAEGKLKKIPIAGGPPQIICDLPNDSAGGSWNQNGVIILRGKTAGISRVSASGGRLTDVTIVDRSRKENFHARPMFLPDGQHFLYLRSSTNDEISGIYLGSLDVKPEQQSLQRLLPGHLGIGYAPTSDPALGYVLFLQDDTLMAQVFDNHLMQLTGEPIPIAERVGSNGASTNYFSVSGNGALIYRTAAVNKSQLRWFDRKGKALGTLGDVGAYGELAVSPDGNRVVVSRRDTKDYDLWVMDSTGGNSTRLTFTSGNFSPLWFPGGDEVFFAIGRLGHFDLYRKSANGEGQERLILQSEKGKLPNDVSSDGKFLIYTQSQNAIFELPLDGDSKPSPFLVAEGNHAKFSPDGRWVLYTSRESGIPEIYVRPFRPKAGSEGKWMISNNGGVQPRWRRDGKEILYLSPSNGALTAVEVSTDPTFKAGTPKALFPIELLPAGAGVLSLGWMWDATPDGQRFLFNTADPGEVNNSPVNVVLNWTGLLKK